MASTVVETRFSSFSCKECNDLDGVFDDQILGHSWTMERIGGQPGWNIKHKNKTVTQIFATFVIECRKDGSCKEAKTTNKAEKNHVHKKKLVEQKSEEETSDKSELTYEEIVQATKKHFQSAAYLDAVKK